MAVGLTYSESRALRTHPLKDALLFGLVSKGPASRGRAAVARRAHNPEVGGSNPSPATNQELKRP